ncbi:MAG: hypothetical protein A4E49_01828 [Methanosaeta sp. PtaU1.Bin112]|nr:MAG: hypothetical protein A4E49_01828 [Methanosaeta sp. PtaU1.Bin112]
MTITAKNFKELAYHRLSPVRAAIPAEVRSLRAEFDRFKKTHNDFAVRTLNEIDYAKINERPTAPGKKQD